MKQRLKTTFMLLPTAVIWGFAFVAQVLGSDYVGAFTFNGVRFLLGALSLFPLCLFAERERSLDREWRLHRKRRTALIALPAGALLFAASALQQIGTTFTRDPGKAGFITGLYTIFTPILYFVIFRKRPGLNIWLGCVLATVGLYLICLRTGGESAFGVGELFLLGGSVVWALHILLIDRFIDEVCPMHFSLGQFSFCGVLSMATAFLFEEVTWSGIWNARWALLYCGILSVGVAYTIQVFGQRDADPNHAAIIFSTESVFAALGGVLWNVITPTSLHVTMEILPVGVLGALIIFLGIVVSQMRFRSKRAKDNLSERKTIT